MIDAVRTGLRPALKLFKQVYYKFLFKIVRSCFI